MQWWYEFFTSSFLNEIVGTWILRMKRHASVLENAKVHTTTHSRSWMDYWCSRCAIPHWNTPIYTTSENILAWSERAGLNNTLFACVIYLCVCDSAAYKYAYRSYRNKGSITLSRLCIHIEQKCSRRCNIYSFRALKCSHINVTVCWLSVTTKIRITILRD